MPAQERSKAVAVIDDKRGLAARIMQVFPAWLVLWGAYTGEFWAFRCFEAPAGTILHATDPSILAGQMHRLQRAVTDELR
jgi:hypothetical protein